MNKPPSTQAAAIEDQVESSSDTWVRRTRWPGHLRGFSRPWLISRLQMPEVDNDEVDTDEKQLAYVLLAIERVIWHAQYACRPEVVGAAVLYVVEQRETGAGSNEKPFYAEQQGKTIRRYTDSVKAIIAYIWRTHRLDPYWYDEEEMGNDQEETEIDDRRPAYTITTAQASAFDIVRMRTEQMIASIRPDSREGSHEGSDEGNSDNSSEGSGNNNRPSIEKQVKWLESSVLEWYIALLDHPITDNEFSNAIYSALAVMGCRSDNGWTGPSEFTPKLSAIVTTAKMMVVYKAKLDRDREIEEFQEDGMPKQEANETAMSHFERVRDMVVRFMTLIDASARGPTPMDSILRLRTYGRRIHDTTNAPGVVDWYGDTLLYGQQQFTMNKLRTMIHGLLHEAREQLWREVLLLGSEDELPVIRVRVRVS
ncbi:hypothetical protein F5B18DRAFT_639645 [Nemania serpens]|nr:hypothetical protein F5B18DRAFT_639645 [Nemania serpens]